MSPSQSLRLWPIALLGVAAWAHAGQPDPLDASAAVPPAVHESAFLGYRRHADVSPRDWKATNDAVGRLGGSRTHAREAHPPAAAAAPATPTASPGHHGSHGQPTKGAP